VKAKKVLVAPGGRPYIPPNIKGAREYAITSDDLFWLKKSPGKTLVVGGSYIALECAGFLHELGLDVTVAIRAVALRGFDRQMADKVTRLNKDDIFQVTSILQVEKGTKFAWGVEPREISKKADGKLIVSFTDDKTEEFDTVLFATGRRPETEKIGLPAEGYAAAAMDVSAADL
jgi:thioredoxin reductase (NADPH)